MTAISPIIETVHFMADLETLGLRHRPVLTSIGVVAFSAASGILGRFYAGVDIASCMRHGAHIDPDTLMYWLDPKKDVARAEWVSLPKLEIDDALDALVNWTTQWDRVAKRNALIVEIPIDADTVVYERGSLWGKGSTFDCVHLREAAHYTNIDWPFSFRQDECYRTLVNRYPHIVAPANPDAHQAIADAEVQALHLIQIIEATGLTL